MPLGRLSKNLYLHLEVIKKNFDVGGKQNCYFLIKIITPDPNHKVDETQLQKSIQKSKDMMAVVEEYKRKRAVSNS